MTATRARLCWAWQQHRDLLALWCLPVGLMAYATATDADHVARWALLLGLFALLASCARIAKHVVTRLTQIVALWEEDVPQAEGLARLYTIPARHKGDRAREQA